MALAAIGWAWTWRKWRITTPSYLPERELRFEWDALLIIALIAVALLIRWLGVAYWPSTAYDARWVYAYQGELYALKGFIPNSIGTDPWLGNLPQMIYAGLFKPAGWALVDYRPSQENLRALAALLASGAVRVVVDRRYPLEQAGAAVAHMLSHRARGKIVVEVEAAAPAGA